jgi:hypothetical protein
MSLFNRPKKNTKIPFIKEDIILDIIERMEEEYPEWFVCELPESSICDFILIKSFNKEIKTTINSLNPYTNIKEELIQKVIAIDVLPPSAEIDEKRLEKTKSWTSLHLIVSDPEVVFRTIKDMK